MTRPVFHLSSARNWVNDPNGLVFHEGRYHAFFQYNPHGATHGYMSWGHASSTDLVHWTEHPVAIRYTAEREIFSGSAVIDEHNTSGLGAPGTSPLIAVFTLADQPGQHQAQGIAVSADAGLTWTMYDGNPVLDRGSSDFRDPKVFRYSGPAGEYWVMVAVEAVERRIVLYRSDDLKAWTYLSDYGARGATGGVWECPDLFPLAVDGDASDVRWVLVISLNPGGIAGGSGTQYVLGSFDGVTFLADEPGPPAAPDEGWANTRAQLEGCSWIDHGRDCYAGVTFSGLAPKERLFMAWMSNWDYAGDMPGVGDEGAQRGAMTLVRRLSLVSRAGRIRLRQQPIGPRTLPVERVHGVRLAADETLEAEAPAQALIRLRLRFESGARAELRLGDLRPSAILSLSPEELRLDRRPGATGLPAAFGSVETLPRDGGETLEADLWLDEGSIELFTDDGTGVLTDRIAARDTARISLRAVGGRVRVEELSVHTPVERGADPTLSEQPAALIG